MGTAFATDDDPGNPLQVHGSQGSQQGFKGEEANRCRRHGEVADAGAHRVILNGDATPDMGRCGVVGIPALEVAPHPQAALGEHLVDMAVHSFHLCKDLINEPVGDAFVEEIPHGVDEDHPWPAPLRRLLQP